MKIKFLLLFFLPSIFVQLSFAQTRNIIELGPPEEKYKVDPTLNRDRNEDYLSYLLDQNDIFIEYSIFPFNQINDYTRLYPENVLSNNFRKLADSGDFSAQLGFTHQSQAIANLSIILGYRQFQKREVIDIESLDAIQIERNYQYRIPSLSIMADIPLRNFHFYIGFRGSYLRESVIGKELFSFNSQEEFASLFPEFDFVSDQNADFLISSTPTLPYNQMDYLNLSLNWALSYKQSLAPNLFVELVIYNPIFKTGGLSYRLTKIEESPEALWQNHYYLLPNTRQLIIADYLSLRLGYSISSKKNVVRFLAH